MSNLLTRLRARRAETGDKGFTLVELLVVVVIIGVLIAIAIPVYLNYTKGAKDKSAASDLRNAIVQLEQCQSDNNSYPSAIDGTTGAITGCGTTTPAPTLKLSPNTTVVYAYTAGSQSYKITSTNSGGKGVTWCYNSLNGGPVTNGTC